MIAMRQLFQVQVSFVRDLNGYRVEIIEKHS